MGTILEEQRAALVGVQEKARLVADRLNDELSLPASEEERAESLMGSASAATSVLGEASLSALVSLEESLQEVLSFCEEFAKQTPDPSEAVCGSSTAEEMIARLYREIAEAGERGDKREALQCFRQLRRLQKAEAERIGAEFEKSVGATLAQGDELIRRAESILDKYGSPAAHDASS